MNSEDITQETQPETITKVVKNKDGSTRVALLDPTTGRFRKKEVLHPVERAQHKTQTFLNTDPKKAPPARTRQDVINQSLFEIVQNGVNDPKGASASVNAAKELRTAAWGKEPLSELDRQTNKFPSLTVIFPTLELMHPEPIQENSHKRPLVPAWVAEQKVLEGEYVSVAPPIRREKRPALPAPDHAPTAVDKFCAECGATKGVVDFDPISLSFVLGCGHKVQA